ncbi:hypothetical protein PVAP13_2KG474400 [Panicum virgatum]|uniref:Uncharacterized protein n=1 Tax=Panicum virgatum TaxID=38727 RepID=A0A8T0WFB3_PANVG|nr:hypothetical protein PVAP13_2KG474400 [Panicum virgatum]
MQLEKLLPIMFCYSITKCKMKLLTAGNRELIILSNKASVCFLYQSAIWFKDETSKLCCKWLMAEPAQCISGKLQYDHYKIPKHRAYALCIYGKISWPPPVSVWSSNQHQFNKFWRDSLMCYSDLIVKFNLSGCLQSAYSAPIEEKLTQHRLRWFGHVQRRPPEAPVRNGVLERVDNVKRGRGRPKLT